MIKASCEGCIALTFKKQHYAYTCHTMSASVPTCVYIHSSITVHHGFPFVYRWIYSHDSSLPSKEENRLLCDPDIPALHHDSHPLPGLLLAQSRIGASQDCLWWVFCVDYSDSSPFYVTEKGNSIHSTQTRHYEQEASLTFVTLWLLSWADVKYCCFMNGPLRYKENEEILDLFYFKFVIAAKWETAKQFKEKKMMCSAVLSADATVDHSILLHIHCIYCIH